jgi:hypothetical protein
MRDAISGARKLLFGLAVAAALGFGAGSALASGPAAAAKCPTQSVGACATTAECKGICQSLGYPITNARCAFVSGRGCCICSL